MTTLNELRRAIISEGYVGVGPVLTKAGKPSGWADGNNVCIYEDLGTWSVSLWLPDVEEPMVRNKRLNAVVVALGLAGYHYHLPLTMPEDACGAASYRRAADEDLIEIITYSDSLKIRGQL